MAGRPRRYRGMERWTRIWLYIEERGICGICHEPVCVDEFTVDHKLPRSKGGTDARENLQLAHPACVWPRATGSHNMTASTPCAKRQHREACCCRERDWEYRDATGYRWCGPCGASVRAAVRLYILERWGR